MTAVITRWHPRYSAFTPLAWIAAACLVGLAAASLDTALLVAAFALVAYVVLALVTPLAAVTVLLVLAPMRTLIATESPFQLPLDIGQLAFLALLLSWVIYRISRGERPLRVVFSPISASVLVFAVITGLTAFNAQSTGAWLNEWLKWVQILVLIVLAHDIAGDTLWHWLVFGLVLSGLANALVGLYQFFGGSGALHLLIDGRFFRAFGTFGQPNPFGGFMGLLAPLALMAALASGGRLWARWRARLGLPVSMLLLTGFYGLAATMIMGGILMSWSRGAWLALAISLGAVLMALPRRAWRGLLVAAIALGVGALLWLAGVLPASVTNRISSSTAEFLAFEDVRGVDITPENYAVIERLAHWQAALNMADSHLWLGVGLGNYEVVYARYRLLNWIEPLGHAHNYYLNILAEAGIIGVLGYGKVWLLIMWATWRARRHPDFSARCIVVGLLGTWTYLGIHSFFDNLYVNNLFLHLGLMLGVLSVLYNQTWRYTRLGVS